MKHLYKVNEWESASRWYVNDTQDLAGVAGEWWVAARVLGLSLPEYVCLLKDKFDASHFFFRGDVEKSLLMFSFDTQLDARAYKNYINEVARNKNFLV
jgi:hypothetical protein